MENGTAKRLGFKATKTDLEQLPDLLFDHRLRLRALPGQVFVGHNSQLEETEDGENQHITMVINNSAYFVSRSTQH